MFELPTHDFKELTPIPKEYYTENRTRVLAELKTQMGDKLKPHSFVLLKGHENHPKGSDDDCTSDNQPEPNFFYLFGLPCVENLHGLIDVDSGEAVLVIRNLSELDLIFDGGITKESIPKELNVNRIITESDLEAELRDKCKGDVFLLKGKIRNNMTKEASFPWLSALPSKNEETLYSVLCKCRAVKTKIEQDIMREVVKITCEGHRYMMKQVKPDMGEHHLAEMFKLHCGLNGTHKLAYGTIVGSGRNASILHYIVNSKVCKDGELVLCDVGIMGNGYCADVTSTFPVNGKFDPKQKEIYNACLRAQVESMHMVKPGVQLRQCQARAFEIICEDLLKIGIFKDATPKELVEKRLWALVMPHSLGHYLGLYTHDVGCCVHSDKDNCTVSTPVTGDVNLEAGFVVTVEPGIYFIRSIIEDHKKNPEKAKYINFDKVEEYFYVGGVRIEDDVLVTETGFENLSPLPRTVEEIEAFMQAK
jgi:Xaa-Pro dipeptidase